MRSFPTAQDPILSLLQSAAASLERRGNAAASRRDVDRLVRSRQDPTASYAGPASDLAGAVDCASLGLALLRARLADDAARVDALRDRIRFGSCDPGWAEAIVDYAGRFLPAGIARPIPYRRYASLDAFVVDAASNRVRIGLLSDWGTGTDEANAVAALLARQRPDIVIHLGDIYYAGTDEECDAHFLAPLRNAMPDVRLFTLCGNHDVYSGGGGYYRLLDRIGQPASYFALRAPDRSWQILGADTGFHDRDPFDVASALTFLDPAEEDWHEDKLRGFGGRTILLTHHQPFSAFAQIGPLAARDPTNPRLLAAHDRLVAAGPIDAWFWGHEHSLRLYAPYRGVRRGRNIGYGAIPVSATALPTAPLPDLHDPPALAAAVPLDVVDGIYAHGFTLLDLHPERIDASYWAVTRPDGPIHRETIDPAGSPIS